jgi:hypothetical protein
MDRMQALPLADQDRWMLLHSSLQRRVGAGRPSNPSGGAQGRRLCPHRRSHHRRRPPDRPGHHPPPPRRPRPLPHKPRARQSGVPRSLRRRTHRDARRPRRVLALRQAQRRGAPAPVGGPAQRSGRPLEGRAEGGQPRALYESYNANSVQGRSARSHLLSCACRPASPWLNTLPYTPAFELMSGEVRTGLRHRLGLSMLPSNAPAVQCDCGTTLRPTEADHGMWCLSVSAHTTLRHDILKDFALCRAQGRHRLHPRTRHPPPLWPFQERWHSATGASARVEARGDIAGPGGITRVDISITHPLAINTLAAAATTACTAAARREQQKRTTYSRVEPNGYPFVPFSVESYGHIGQSAMNLLHALGDEAAGPDGVTRASFVANALREICVGLCRGNFFMYRACLGMFAKSSGTGFRAGMSVPKDEHGLL